ncbi:MAG: hypothetical protein ACYDC9_05560 [Dermatophilaceae bacterium]
MTVGQWGSEAVGMQAVGMQAVGMQAVGMQAVGMQAVGMQAVGSSFSVPGQQGRGGGRRLNVLPGG